MALPNIAKEKIYKKMTLLSGLEVQVRPWTVGDKKDFLIQLELSKGDNVEAKKIMMNLIENCLSAGKDINKMTKNDIIQVLAELRKHAEGDLVDFAVPCPHCGKKNTEIQLSISKDIKTKPFDHSPITISDRLQIVVRDLPEKTRIALQNKYSDSEMEYTFYYLVNSIVSVMDGDEIFKNFTEEEMVKWLDDIDDFSMFEKLTKELANKKSAFTITKEIECQHCAKKIKVSFEEPERFFVL